MMALCLAVACGKDETASSETIAVRGEPIQVAEVRGEPIAKPGAEAAEAKEATSETEAVSVAETAKKSVAAASESVVVERTPEVGAIVSDEKLVAAAKAAVAQSEETAAGVLDATREIEKVVNPEAEMKKARIASPESAALEPAKEKAEAMVAEIESAPIGPNLAPAPEAAAVAAKPEVKEASAATPEAEIPVIKSGDQEYHQVGFDHLSSFEYEMPDEFGEVDAAVEEGPAEGEANGDEAQEVTVAAGPEGASEEKDQIPANVRKFDNKRVALEGFMLPLKVEDSLVTEMLIMRDQSMCCFGSVPKINEWVSIRMTGKGVKPVMDEPVTIYGKLKVGEVRENGYLVGIYEMDGERMGSRIDL